MWSSFHSVPRLAVLVSVCVFAISFGHRSVFIPVGNPPVLFDSDEREMHEASIGAALGATPQRLIWPGGLVRHAGLLHLGLSWVLDRSGAKTPDSFARHIGKILIEPEGAYLWIRGFNALISALGFAMLAGLAVRSGCPPEWAVMALSTAQALPLHLMHGSMITPDGLAWGLLLTALVLGWKGGQSLWWVLVSGSIAGLAVGCKLTILPMLPAAAILAARSGPALVPGLAAWSTGLLLGALVANPFFLADPVRLAKTLIGVLKFKESSMMGWPGALNLLLAAIPAWLLALGSASLFVAWRKGARLQVYGALVSAAWLLHSTANSRQVVERYYPPLGIVLLFYVLVFLLPRLAEARLSRRWWMTAGLALATGVIIISSHTRVKQIQHQAQEGSRPALVASDVIQKKAFGRVAVDSALFLPVLIQRGSASGFDEQAEYLESSRVEYRTLAQMLGNFHFTPEAVRVLGGLFNEVEVNQAARLRAMATASTGPIHIAWFFNGDQTALGRIWKHGLPDARRLLDAGEVEAVFFRKHLPESFIGYPFEEIKAGSDPIFVVTKSNR
jgi:hypothetical protein